MFSQKIITASFLVALALTGFGCTNKNIAQFKVPELGLDLAMPRAIAEDLTYQIREERGDTIVMIGSKKLSAAAPQECANKYGLGPIGNISKQIRLEDPTGGQRAATPGRDHKVGDHYLSYLKPVTTCVTDDALKTYQLDAANVMAEVWTKLDTAGLPQRF